MKGIDFDVIQRKAVEMIRGLEYQSYKDGMRGLDLFSLEKTPGRYLNSSILLLRRGLQEREGETLSKAV